MKMPVPPPTQPIVKHPWDKDLCRIATKLASLATTLQSTSQDIDGVSALGYELTDMLNTVSGILESNVDE